LAYFSCGRSCLLFVPSKFSWPVADRAHKTGRGFELMTLDREPLRAVSFPDWTQLKNDPRAMELQKRCNESKAVGMYRISDAVFLFVFEDLAFYADKHGDPIKTRYNDVVDFQGTARTVAYLPPYIIAFDTNFIEVRHAATGKLCQILKGREILCTYDGQSPLHRTASEAEKRIHVALQSDGGFDTSYRVVRSFFPRFALLICLTCRPSWFLASYRNEYVCMCASRAASGELGIGRECEMPRKI
jgi:hypothetical protein